MADEFNPRRMGCPLVQLTKSCHQMRVEMDCPKFRKFLVRSTTTGADDTIEACADWWLPLMQRDAVAVMARTEKAVELRGDLQVEAANQSTRLLLQLAGLVELDAPREVADLRARIDRATQLALPPPGKPAG